MIGNKNKIRHTVNQKKGQFSSQTCRDTSSEYTESQEQSEPTHTAALLGQLGQTPEIWEEGKWMDRQTGMLMLGVRGKGEHLGYLPKPKTFS